MNLEEFKEKFKSLDNESITLLSALLGEHTYMNHEIATQSNIYEINDGYYIFLETEPPKGKYDTFIKEDSEISLAMIFGIVRKKEILEVALAFWIFRFNEYERTLEERFYDYNETYKKRMKYQELAKSDPVIWEVTFNHITQCISDESLFEIVPTEQNKFGIMIFGRLLPGVERLNSIEEAKYVLARGRCFFLNPYQLLKYKINSEFEDEFERKVQISMHCEYCGKIKKGIRSFLTKNFAKNHPDCYGMVFIFCGNEGCCKIDSELMFYSDKLVNEIAKRIQANGNEIIKYNVKMLPLFSYPKKGKKSKFHKLLNSIIVRFNKKFFKEIIKSKINYKYGISSYTDSQKSKKGMNR
ncbi:MAG: hypothetical protein SFU98_06300 [Leptospiraceae bacterium]|nr:hypothetical protein [Leptospiraceae bacterium]